MNRVNNASRFLGMILVFGAIGALGISAIPNAVAMNTVNSPDVTTEPGVPVVNGIAPTIVLTTPDNNSVPTENTRIGVVEPLSTGIIVSQIFPADPNCNLPTYTSGAGSYWIFMDGANQAEFEFKDPNDTVHILFADGVINPIYGGTGPASGPASGEWIDANLLADKTPIIDILATETPFDPYTVETCGFDRNGGSFTQPFQNTKFLFTQESMAGEIIPIDATALILGGITSPSMMMLPLLAIAAGGAFVFLRFQVLRKD